MLFTEMKPETFPKAHAFAKELEAEKGTPYLQVVLDIVEGGLLMVAMYKEGNELPDLIVQFRKRAQGIATRALDTGRDIKEAILDARKLREIFTAEHNELFPDAEKGAGDEKQ